MIYLDNAATTLHKPYTVSEAAQKAIRRMTTPGRGGHSASMLAAETAYRCRERAASLFGVNSPESIVLTFNATHALNIAIKSLAREGSRVLISGYEHNSVVRPLNTIGARVIVAVSELFEPEDAVRAFERRLGGAELVVINHTSNVFGYILPVERIAEMCKAARVPLIIDASQSAGVVDIDFERLGADFIAMPGHKGLYGPQGTGILIARGGKTLIEGGTGGNSQLPEMPDFLPDRLEAGTHNMPGIAGLEQGLKFVEKVGTKKILAHEKALVRQAADGLGQIAGIRLYKANNEENQTGVLSFNLRDLPSEQVAGALSERNIAVRAGLHCAPLAHRSVGTLSQGTVRMSVSVFNTKFEINRMLNHIEDISKKIK
ncbi:MAG: aminotransferase class V-fold PLP-dependent enzyme [Clostridiales bacterium]|nr:aminotransferase class V-fold PLP-dependent enzyme [Clostridiales bacterium]